MNAFMIMDLVIYSIIILKRQSQMIIVSHNDIPFTKCMRCKEQLADPVMLPCLDLFCLPCAEELQQTAGTCPACLEPVNIAPNVNLNLLPFYSFARKLLTVARIEGSTSTDLFCEVCNNASHGSIATRH